MSKPIFTWMGGKRRMAKHILPEFPEHECYVEPFCGGAALFFMKEPSKVEVINDFDHDVVNLYRVVANHLDEFVRQFRWSLVSRTMFDWAKMQRPETLTDIQRAPDSSTYSSSALVAAQPTGLLAQPLPHHPNSICCGSKKS